MSIALALKRTYRHFAPPFDEVRRFVRKLYVPAFFYIVGQESGMYKYARPEDVARITKQSMVAIVVLLVLGWWSGMPGSRRSPEA